MESSHDYPNIVANDFSPEIKDWDQTRLDQEYIDIQSNMAKASSLVEIEMLAVRGWLLSQRQEELNQTVPEQPRKALQYEIGVASQTRKLPNEDSFIADTENRYVVICDGVGSTKNGKLASSIGAEVIAEYLENIKLQKSLKASKRILKAAITEANKSIINLQRETGLSMATTVSCLAVVEIGSDHHAVIGNVGDGPVYLKDKKGKVKELTNYHDNLPTKPIKRPALGKPNWDKFNIYSVKLKPGTVVMVSSNGMRKNDPFMNKIRQYMRKPISAQKMANKLINKLGEVKISRDARTAGILAVQY